MNKYIGQNVKTFNKRFSRRHELINFQNCLFEVQNVQRIRFPWHWSRAYHARNLHNERPYHCIARRVFCCTKSLEVYCWLIPTFGPTKSCNIFSENVFMNGNKCERSSYSTLCLRPVGVWMLILTHLRLRVFKTGQAHCPLF